MLIMCGSSCGRKLLCERAHEQRQTQGQRQWRESRQVFSGNGEDPGKISVASVMIRAKARARILALMPWPRDDTHVYVVQILPVSAHEEAEDTMPEGDLDLEDME